MAKDALGHGSEARGGMDARSTPLSGHPYHLKSNAELQYIARDASEAARNMRGVSAQAEGKYLDQVNDASTVLGFRQRGGSDFSRQGDDKAAAAELARGNPKADVVPVHSGAAGRLNEQGYRTQGTAYEGPRYNREAVNKAIASSNRSGRPIGGREARMIHSLLKGRQIGDS